jgi:hypothetical protein
LSSHSHALYPGGAFGQFGAVVVALLEGDRGREEGSSTRTKLPGRCYGSREAYLRLSCKPKGPEGAVNSDLRWLKSLGDSPVAPRQPFCRGVPGVHRNLDSPIGYMMVGKVVGRLGTSGARLDRLPKMASASQSRPLPQAPSASGFSDRSGMPFDARSCVSRRCHVLSASLDLSSGHTHTPKHRGRILHASRKQQSGKRSHIDLTFLITRDRCSF